MTIFSPLVFLPFYGHLHNFYDRLWKRDNFNNTLTFTEKTLKASNQLPSRIFSGVSGDSYTFYQDDDFSYITTLTIKLVNGNLEISGDSGSGEDNWNGIWKKPIYPSGFIGTWKRDNFNNTLTFTKNTLQASNHNDPWTLQSISGDNYSLSNPNRPNYFSVTILLRNGNLVISGDSDSGHDNWNGTWKKQ